MEHGSKIIVKNRLGAFTKIASYINENNLIDPNNRRNIIPDEKLRKILRPLKEGDNEYTNFNLINYIPHVTLE